MSVHPVPLYENTQVDSEFKAPIEKPLGFREGPPRHFDDGNDDNVDEDDENSYFSSDEDYIYPELDELEWSASSYGEPESPKEQLDLGEGPKKISMKERFLAKLGKAVPKSPTVFSFNVSGSPQGSRPTPSSLAVPSSSSTSSRAAKGRDLPQSFPDDLGNLSVSKVSECLRLLNMGEHVETFESEQIDGQLFITLNEETLPCLGVIDKFQQQKLLKFIQGWRPVKK